jgi:lysophospholipase L1-like esterase
VLLLALLGSSCSNGGAQPPDAAPKRSTTTTVSSGPTSAPAPPALVTGIGDSQLFDAQGELQAQLPLARVELHAVPGLTLEEGHFGLDLLATLHPEVMGIVLGTNNVRDGSAAEDEGALRDLADRLAAVPCVQWMDLPTSTPDPAFNQGASAFNDLLTTVAGTHPNLRVVAWSAVVEGHENWFQSDRLHLTEEGQAQLATTLAAALRTCPAMRGAP